MTNSLVAVLGQPIDHSLSPVLHNAWAKTYNVPLTYVGLDPANSESCLVLLSELKGCSKFLGANITAPFKTLFCEHDALTRRVEETGAANLLFRSPSGWKLDNTDVLGLMRTILDFQKSFDSVVVLGSGATSASAVVACRELGIRDIRVYSREQFKLRQSAFEIQGCVLVINTLAYGHRGEENPFAEHCLRQLPEHRNNHAYFDVIYRQTRACVMAQSLGMKTESGLKMFIVQAQHSFAAWTGLLPDYDLGFRVLKPFVGGL